MNNFQALVFTGALTFVFFISGIIGILDNFMVQMVLLISFIGFIVWLFKVNANKDKKNLP